MDDSNAGSIVQDGLGAMDYAAVVFYLALTFGISVWFGRKQTTTEDFFVGGRHMPWFTVGLSILATLFSTISYLGMPGEFVKRGIGVFSGYLALPLTVLVVAYVWIPFFMRLRLTSAYEYLELRFSPPVRILGASLFTCLRLGWMGMVVFVGSNALATVKGGDWTNLPGPDVYWIVGSIGLVAAIYTSIGGIQAMMWVDVLQCFLLLFGVLMAIGYVVVVDGTGPITWWAVAAEQTISHTRPPLFSFDPFVQRTIVTAMISLFFWHICTHGSDQVVLQRYFSTASLKSARRSYFINVVADVSMATLLILAGLALMAFYLQHGQRLPAGKTAIGMADELFPYFLGSQLPAGCAGLIMSAFLCDAVQTIESGVNAIAAVISKDLFGKSEKVDGQARDLRAARGLTIVLALLVTGIAFAISHLQEAHSLTIIDMMSKFFNMFVGPLAATFFVGMFLPRCTTRSVLPAALVGIVIAVLWSWCDVIFGIEKLTILLSIAVPCVTTFVLAALLSLFVETGGDHRGRAFTWRAILRRVQVD